MNAALRQSGTSLLETLAASALAGFLVIVLVKLYQLSSDTYLQSAMRTEALNTVLTAEHVLHRSFHLASTRLCGSGSIRHNLVRQLDELDSFVHGVHVAQPRQLRRGRYKIMGDAVTAHKTGPPHRLVEHNRTSRHFLLQQASSFSPGDLVVVCDPRRTVLIQITAVRDEGQTLSYEHRAKILPGNCHDAFASCLCGCDYAFDQQAVLAAYQPLILFVSPRPNEQQTDAERALFRSYLVVERSSGRSTARLHSEELVAGVVFARAMLNDHGANLQRLDYGIVVSASRKQGLTEPVYLFAQDVSSFLPAGQNKKTYYSYEFSFSL